jgi:hypothetical protein
MPREEIVEMFIWKVLKEKRHLETRGINVMAVLNSLSYKYVIFEVVGWIRLAEVDSIGGCEHGNEPWDSLKGRVFIFISL